MKRLYYFSELSSVVQADEIKVDFLRRTALEQMEEISKGAGVIIHNKKLCSKGPRKIQLFLVFFCCHVDL